MLSQYLCAKYQETTLIRLRPIYCRYFQFIASHSPAIRLLVYSASYKQNQRTHSCRKNHCMRSFLTLCAKRLPFSVSDPSKTADHIWRVSTLQLPEHEYRRLLGRDNVKKVNESHYTHGKPRGFQEASLSDFKTIGT